MGFLVSLVNFIGYLLVGVFSILITANAVQALWLPGREIVGFLALMLAPITIFAWPIYEGVTHPGENKLWFWMGAVIVGFIAANVDRRSPRRF